MYCMRPENGKKTPISSLGEFGLIEHLTRWAGTTHSCTVKGVGDDAAVTRHGDRHTVVTTDLLLEGIHFNLVYTPLKHLGYKAVVVNLSDVYAMNAVPGQVTVSLGISGKFFVEDMEELYEGVRLACEHYGVDMVGGDISASMTGLIISVTAMGESEPEKLAYRNGARPGDLLCVSGDLGAAYMGLQVLEREKKLYEADPSVQPKLEGYDYVLQRQLKPEARRDVVEFFRKEGLVPHAMIDISDGLSSDLLHICHQSEVGCRLYVDRIPVHEETRKVAEEFSMEPETAALNGGEDYELLFTLPGGLGEKIIGVPGITVLGEIISGKDEKWLITSGGNRVPLVAQGWNQIR